MQLRFCLCVSSLVNLFTLLVCRSVFRPFRCSRIVVVLRLVVGLVLAPVIVCVIVIGNWRTEGFSQRG